MSRIGKQPILFTPEVTVKIDDRLLSVAGPKGNLTYSLPSHLDLTIDAGQIIVQVDDRHPQSNALSGLYRSLINNLVVGVMSGFEKTLKLVGTGYRAALEGNNLVINCGFSHPVKISPPTGILFQVKENDTVIVSGLDKELVGRTCATIRKVRPPEPYKGKGIRYENEVVRRKAGKTGKAATGGAA